VKFDLDIYDILKYRSIMDQPTLVYKILPRLIDVVSTTKMYQLRRLNRTWMYLFRTLSVGRITDKYESKPAKLTASLAYLNYLPIQGTQAWLDQRIGKTGSHEQKLLADIHCLDAGYKFPPPIGGSEISALRGGDKFKTTFQLAREKLGLSRFDGSVNTNWGKIFEDILRQYTEIVFDTEIYETGSVPGVRNEFGAPIQSYSPDGIGTVQARRIREVLDRENIKFSEAPEYRELLMTDELRNVLFEFKCPLRRKPTGKVPDNYCDQPQLGMASLSFPELAIFGDAVFRKCRVDDFDFSPKYDGGTPPTIETARFKDTPLILGFIGIYEPGTRGSMKLECGTVEVFKKLTIDIYNHSMEIVSDPSSEYHTIHTDTYGVALVAVNAYDIFMTRDEYVMYELSESDRFKILHNVIRKIVPEFARAPFEACREQVAAAVKFVDLSQKNHDLGNLNVGVDLGISKMIKDYPRDFNHYIVLPPDHIKTAIDEGRLFNGEEFYSITDYAVKGIEYKFYTPDKFCYKMDNPYLSDFSKDNKTDTMLTDKLRCKKWLYQNLKKFEIFCKREGHRPAGYMPYKLVKLNYIPVYKKPGYIDTIIPDIEAFQVKLAEARAAGDQIDQKIHSLYNQAYAASLATVSENNFNDEPLDSFSKDVPDYSTSNVVYEQTVSDSLMSFDDFNSIV
jgi:hypothetical protein